MWWHWFFILEHAAAVTVVAAAAAAAPSWHHSALLRREVSSHHHSRSKLAWKMELGIPSVEGHAADMDYSDHGMTLREIKLKCEQNLRCVGFAYRPATGEWYPKMAGTGFDPETAVYTQNHKGETWEWHYVSPRSKKNMVSATKQIKHKDPPEDGDHSPEEGENSENSEDGADSDQVMLHKLLREIEKGEVVEADAMNLYKRDHEQSDRELEADVREVHNKEGNTSLNGDDLSILRAEYEEVFPSRGGSSPKDEHIASNVGKEAKNEMKASSSSDVRSGNNSDSSDNSNGTSLNAVNDRSWENSLHTLRSELDNYEGYLQSTLVAFRNELRAVASQEIKSGQNVDHGSAEAISNGLRMLQKQLVRLEKRISASAPNESNVKDLQAEMHTYKQHAESVFNSLREELYAVNRPLEA
jgi:hypothetical protein